MNNQGDITSQWKEVVKKRHANGECVGCGEKLKKNYPMFTGVCNFHNGQYYNSDYCDNLNCIRYALAVNVSIREKR
jgi:hypothetical protein